MTGALATPRLASDIDVPLTQRESEVLRQLSYGLTNKEIAQSLHISYETVKEHVQHILRKLGVSDRTQAAVWAVRKGLVYAHRSSARLERPDHVAGLRVRLRLRRCGRNDLSALDVLRSSMASRRLAGLAHPLCSRSASAWPRCACRRTARAPAQIHHGQQEHGRVDSLRLERLECLLQFGAGQTFEATPASHGALA